MARYDYRKYKILIAPDSRKRQGLSVGDVVRRQYLDPPRSINSLMVVLEVGVEIIGGQESAYFIGALIEGDAPQTGELLDFVRVTSLLDEGRSGALYLTASDSESPFLDVIDGIAKERSLCYPTGYGGTEAIPDSNRYSCMGEKYLIQHYEERRGNLSRIYRLTRNKVPSSESEKLGFRQVLERCPEHPAKLLVSYRIRACRKLQDVESRFGYSSDEKIEGTQKLTISSEWEYHLFAISVDYPAAYERAFTVDLTGKLAEDEWCEIADLNIIPVADIAAFGDSTKVRIGKVAGVVDPVFGVLEGYGAYFQNLYATRNVNIAGTLTAGDENGFSSTFYVGKIHKNVIPDSCSGRFMEPIPIATPVTPPAGVGQVWRMDTALRLEVQTAAWRTAHIGEQYCFSLWIKAEKDTTVSLFQDDLPLKEISLAVSDGWCRYHCSFRIRESSAPSMVIRIDASVAGLLVCSPQLEAGAVPSQYQPTDGTLSYVEDYGAWFSKGGIGGTIQNPLLRLDEDGSIRSRDGSFVINPDGTGQFASGRFRWSKDTITLQDITIRWEDLDEKAKEQLKPRSVTLTGGTAFHYDDSLSSAAEPSAIDIIATEYNFSPTARRWEYQATDGTWKDAGCRGALFRLQPDFHGWEGRETLVLRYTATENEQEHVATHTIFKLYDGQSSYSLSVESGAGTVFRNGVVETILRARVYKGGEEITDRIGEDRFRWVRVSDDSASDALWNAAEHRGRELHITEEDVWRKAVFNCEVEIG